MLGAGGAASADDLRAHALPRPGKLRHPGGIVVAILNDIRPNPQVVRVHLLNNVGVFDIRRGRPSFQSVIGLFEDVCSATLKLRPGSSVQEERLAAVKPFNN